MTQDNGREILSIGGVREAIKRADMVMVNVRFGTNESYSKISKSEARLLIKDSDNNEQPDDWEMSTGNFGRMVKENGLLIFYMG